MLFLLSVLLLLIGPWFGVYLVRVFVANKRMQSDLQQAPEQQQDTTAESAAEKRIL